ncbi:STAS domain-containing protein [Polyangium aurulentum]|uniref:STAS domain-containing protein n=1 Tax=Polyangium aurulentum TaxID=2567896 RepID=UPI0010AE64C7|nr:STAS domain-containing protein [Polyangium aurulentum]UQA60649.1 STAS domain-containing protein [Polyangium aurulentum]
MQPRTDAAGRVLLLDLLARRRADVLERSTDWVVEAAGDLKGRRPREETRRLVDRVIATNLAVIEGDDRRPLEELIDYVTSYRAASEFRVSTLLRGFLSFKRGVSQVLEEEGTPAEGTLAALRIVDEVYYEATFAIADLYGEKLVLTVTERRRELEVELGEKQRQLEEKIETIDEQRRALAALSSPVLRVWAGVLLVPLIGEITHERALHARSKLLAAIEEQGAEAVLIDVTGLSVADAHAASVIVDMVRAARLVGAEGLLAGMRGEVARTFVTQGEDLAGTRTFATLEDGLRHLLRQSNGRRLRLAATSR